MSGEAEPDTEPEPGVTTPLARPGAGAAPTGSLSDVLPAVAAALGAGGRETAFTLPPARRVCVLLVDGLGERLLAARGGHAPFLRSLLPQGRVLAASYPTTTATSMGTFGTGLLPGAHGMVGYLVRDPDTGRPLNELSWEDGPDPRVWQPHPTVLEQVAAAGVEVTRVGPGFFDGSGLTEAALRGGRFVAARTLESRVDAALAALRASRRSLVYLYWGDVDKVGHVEGAASFAWGEEVAAVDLAVRRLAGSLPADALLLVTADHGMVDVPPEQVVDLAADAELSAGVAMTGGEPRAPQLYCVPGAADDVLATWRARLGTSFTVLSRADAVAAGWFGSVEQRVLPRIGDVVAAARGDAAVFDRRWLRPELATLVGMHGALTDAETRVPLLSVAGRALS